MQFGSESRAVLDGVERTAEQFPRRRLRYTRKPPVRDGGFGAGGDTIRGLLLPLGDPFCSFGFALFLEPPRRKFPLTRLHASCKFQCVARTSINGKVACTTLNAPKRYAKCVCQGLDAERLHKRRYFSSPDAAFMHSSNNTRRFGRQNSLHLVSALFFDDMRVLFLRFIYSNTGAG